MSSVVAPRVPDFPPTKEYDFDEFAERREILKDRLSRLSEHEMILATVEEEIRENQEKSAKALAEFRALQRELDCRREQCRHGIAQCAQARTELIEIATPDVRKKFLKLCDDLRKHELNFESLKDVPVRPYMVKKVETSQTREELDRWTKRLEEFDRRKTELDAAIAAMEKEILAS